jgi:hypothetical protein
MSGSGSLNPGNWFHPRRDPLHRVYPGTIIESQQLVKKANGGNHGKNASSTNFQPEGAI